MDVAFQILAGWFFIDLLTGVYHYIIDHASPNGWLGSQARDFHEHHLDPLSMERHGFIFRNWLNVVASLPALYFAWLGWPAFWLTVWLGGTVCQQAHHWAHSPAPTAVSALQQLGILISPEAHRRHHRDFERSYGILNGWSHGALDLLLGRIY